MTEKLSPKIVERFRALRARILEHIGEMGFSHEDLAGMLDLLPVGVEVLLGKSSWSFEEALRVAGAVDFEVDVTFEDAINSYTVPSNSHIGEFKTLFMHEILYNAAPGDDGDGPAIEVEIDVTATMHCYDTEDGVVAEDITATLDGRELTEDEIHALDLESRISEAFMDSGRVPPGVGTRLVDAHGRPWWVVGSAKHYDKTDHFLLIESAGGFRRRRAMLPVDHLGMQVPVNGKWVPLFEEAGIYEDSPGKYVPLRSITESSQPVEESYLAKIIAACAAAEEGSGTEAFQEFGVPTMVKKMAERLLDLDFGKLIDARGLIRSEFK